MAAQSIWVPAADRSATWGTCGSVLPRSVSYVRGGLLQRDPRLRECTATPTNLSRERILTALAHREGDRVPFDLGGAGVTGIHEVAYRRLRDALGLPLRHIDLLDVRLGLAAVHEDVRDVLGVDASLVPAEGPSPDHWRLEIRSEGQDRTLRDEFGVGWRQPPGGLYFDVVDHPLSGDIGPAAFDDYLVARRERSSPLPNPSRTRRTRAFR